MYCPQLFSTRPVSEAGGTGNLDGILMDNILILFCITSFIGDVPAKGFKEGIDKFPSELGFIVSRTPVGFDISFETLNKIG